MERKTHMLFTISSIYGIKVLLQKYGIDTSFAVFYISLVSSFPLISIPFQLIATSLPDSDGNTRLRNTILFPAVLVIQLFTKHRGATHDIRGIGIVALALYFLYLLGTNIVVVAFMAFMAATITFVLIDDFRVSVLGTKISKIGFIPIPTKLFDSVLTGILVIFWPLLLIPSVYNVFLVSILFGYVWHMFGDAFTKEGWKPFGLNMVKFQLPSFLAFQVGGLFERVILQPVLIIFLCTLFFVEKDFWLNKLKTELSLAKTQYAYLLNNPEKVASDYNSVEDRFRSTFDFFKEKTAVIKVGK